MLTKYTSSGEWAMRRKFMSAMGAVCLIAGATLFSLAAPATAQPYPPGPCDPPVSANFAGSFAIGSTITFTLPPTCVWNAGAPLTVTVNGVSIPGKVASANGSTTVTITIVSATQLSVDDPILVAGHCGTNTITGVGPSSVSRTGQSTHTTTFDVACDGVAARPARGGTVALTGANVVRWSMIAAGLMLVGGLFVAIDRRRAKATTSD